MTVADWCGLGVLAIGVVGSLCGGAAWTIGRLDKRDANLKSHIADLKEAVLERIRAQEITTGEMRVDVEALKLDVGTLKEWRRNVSKSYREESAGHLDGIRSPIVGRAANY